MRKPNDGPKDEDNNEEESEAPSSPDDSDKDHGFGQESGGLGG